MDGLLLERARKLLHGNTQTAEHGGRRFRFSVQVAQNTSALLPLTPSGIGTEQALIVSNLGGTPAGEALSFGVGMKLALVSVNVIVGFTALLVMARTLRWRRALAAEGALTGRRRS